MFEQGLGRQYEYSKWQGHSKQRERQRGKEEHGAKTGLGDIRLGYKCCLSPFSAGLPTASCCSHLFSCFAIPCTPKPAITSPFPLLPLLTSCPKHMGMGDERGSKLQISRERGVLQERQRGRRAQEWHDRGPGYPMTAFLHLKTFLAVPWPTSRFAQMILTDSVLSADSKEIYKVVKFSKWEGEKNHRLFTKENVWKKDLEQSSNQDLNS